MLDAWLVTEAAAALYGVEVAHRMGYNRIHLEGNAMNVINAISRQHKGLSPIHLIYANIYVFSALFSGFICSHVRRGGISMDSHVEKVFMSSFPQII